MQKSFIFSIRKAKLFQYKMNVKKCKFLEKFLDFLGYYLDSEWLRPSSSKVEAILVAPRPENVTQLKSYLGLINCHHKFIPTWSDLLHRLYRFTKEEFYTGCTTNTVQSKTTTCDSSFYGVGAIISHMIDGIEKPIHYASSTLTDTKANFSQLQRVVLAIVFGIKSFTKYYGVRHFYWWLIINP